jgi:hypothetical protein
MTVSRKTKALPAAPVRCAIYTRKSTEEGLDQDFNSLDAQREAAEAYIHSQAHAGWTVLAARYNDGGYSGSNPDRPALQRLLTDIRARRSSAYRPLTEIAVLSPGINLSHFLRRPTTSTSVSDRSSRRFERSFSSSCHFERNSKQPSKAT